jgi:hypothetical protein
MLLILFRETIAFYFESHIKYEEKLFEKNAEISMLKHAVSIVKIAL